MPGSKGESLHRVHRAASMMMALCLLVPGPLARADDTSSSAVAFGTMPALWNVRLSPDGSKISFLQMHAEDFPIALVFDFASRKVNLLLASEKDRFSLNWCDWANDERLLCGYYAIQKDRHQIYPVTRLVAVNADGKEQKVLLQRRLADTWTQFQDQIVDWLPGEPRHILVTEPDTGGTGVSRLDIYNGRVKPVARTRKYVYAWMSDGRGELRLRHSIERNDYRWDYRLAGEEKWQLLEEWEHAEIDFSFSPVGFGDDPNLLYVLKSNEGRTALWSEDLANGRKSELVFSHPRVDVGGPIRLGKFRRMVAIGYSTDRNHLHFFDKDVGSVTERISIVFPGLETTVIDESWDRHFYIAYVASDQEPGSYVRYDREQDRVDRIASSRPELEGRTLAAMKSIEYRARDGKTISAYLTLPTGPSSKPMRTVILPHGGPHSRDYWGYDWLSQFLSARGYAVLQTNFRGSGGLGDEWLGLGGFRDWRTAIDDITDGARHLVESGIADPQRACIVGWSYGGYAALLSAAEEPGLYRCVISIAGVSDLRMLIRDRKHNLGWRSEREYIGRDQEVLESGSPTERADDIVAPVLLFHGDEDINVYVSHSEKMNKALEKAKKRVAYIEYKEVEHSIRRNRYRIDMLERIGAFLDEHTAKSTKAE